MANSKINSAIIVALLVIVHRQLSIEPAARFGAGAGVAADGLSADSVGSAGPAKELTSQLEKEFQEKLAHRVANPLVPIAHDSEKVSDWRERLGQDLLADMQRIFYEPLRWAKSDSDNYPLLAVAAEAAMVKLTHYALQLRGVTKAGDLAMMVHHGEGKNKLTIDTRLVMSRNFMDILVKRTVWRSLMLGKPVLETHMKRVHLLWKRYDGRPGVRTAIDTYYSTTSADRLEPAAILEDIRRSWTFYNLELFKEGKDIDFQEGIELVDQLVDRVLPGVEVSDRQVPTSATSPAGEPNDRGQVLLESYGEKYILRDVLVVLMKVGAKLDPITLCEQALRSVSMNEVYTYEEIMFYPRSVSASDMRPSNELSKLIIKRSEVIAPAPSL